MPGKPYVNRWFSSSDGHDKKLFNRLLSPRNVDRLAEEGGASIVYTHFASGFVNENGELCEEFKNNIDYLSRQNGWFVPCGTLLDHLATGREDAPSYWYRMKLDLRWILDRIRKKIQHGM
jgi:hypothetical protein